MTKEPIVIGIVGMGFVGKAVYEGFKNHYSIETFDTNTDSTCDTLEQLVQRTDCIFVCLPTPMKPNGACDSNLVSLTVKRINFISYIYDREPVVVIKSTVPVGTTRNLQAECDGIHLIFNPEFLTEANYINDFLNQKYILIGYPPVKHSMFSVAVFWLMSLYRSAGFDSCGIDIGPSDMIEMVKYTGNTFLATKVAFANEIYQICKALDIDYDSVSLFASLDERIGTSHLKVPGPDGHYGFGGSCFIKDINELMYLAKSNGVEPKILNAVWEKNLQVRPEKDWEQLKGRAVT